MMIALKEWQLSLIKKLESENSSDYDVEIIDDEYYIKVDDLFDALNETQNYRQYAEERLIEVSEESDRQYRENIDGLTIHTIEELNRLKNENDELKNENDELKNTIDSIQNTLDEDDYDRLRERGITYYEEHDC